jgi:DNA-directed RNA polymerase III subunit RPC11
VVVCPNCSNCLTIAVSAGTGEYPEGVNAFQCRTCPYQFVLDKEYYEHTYMKKKQRDDVMGEDESSLPINDGKLGRYPTSRELWLMCSQVPGGCPGCQSKKAYFYQLQTRSADEPPTSFYKCVACGKQWREY